MPRRNGSEASRVPVGLCDLLPGSPALQSSGFGWARPVFRGSMAAASNPYINYYILLRI